MADNTAITFRSVRSFRYGIILLFSGALIMICPFSASAFDNGPTWFGFSYTLNTSGARTIGMGGTSVASVSDAGATLSNPAALVRLKKTEIRFDSNFRHIEEMNRPGSDNAGTGRSIQMGLHVGETNQIDPALIALATPVKNSGLVLSLFGHEFLPYDRFVTVTDPISGGISETHSVMFDLDEYGVSAGQSLLGGRVAVGLSASLVDASMIITAKQDRTPQPGSFDGIEFTSYGSKTEQEPVWRFGLLYQPASTLAFGFNYTLTQDPQYTMTTANSPSTVGSAPQNGCTGDINIGTTTEGTPTGNWICISSVPMPKSLAAGFSFSPDTAWNFAAEVVYIEYSRATSEFVASYAYPGGDVRVIQSRSDFTAEDVVEYHFGLEYQAAVFQLPVSFRAGYWFDPAHDIKYSGTDTTSQVIWTGGEDVHHYTTGAGILFMDSLQVDMAVDLPDDNNYRAAVSVAYRY